MKIFILRHGKAEPARAGMADSDRNLTDKGRQQVKKIALWMDQHHYLPQLIISSPYKRAAQTADIISTTLSVPAPVQYEEALIYGENPIKMYDMINALELDSVLLSSHMPLVTELTHLFAPGALNEGFHTAEMIKISFDKQNQHGIVTANITPKEI